MEHFAATITKGCLAKWLVEENDDHPLELVPRFHTFTSMDGKSLVESSNKFPGGQPRWNHLI
jgi:hypothetical protein